ncbi:group 1 glycosyl transferase [Candidatus Omnitrophus magneticus]|uniref:Group 1 glycosyl transferase n=1 Tax=Candidatus Omnitrophus magneticus TaxID=1609969 RepID=A0A0F0CT92_9BACT|nr:group 1 glycosyl transferase [Candidatus Omnitrophus magneticus]
MKVAFYAYPSSFQNPGGGEVQLIKTKEALEKQGVSVKLFDQWNDKLQDFDILHVFGSVKDCVGLMETARNLNVKVVLSPIFWSNFDRAFFESENVSRKAELTLRHLLKLLIPVFPSGRRRTMVLSNVLLPNSIMEKNQIKRLFAVPESKMSVVPNGVDDSFAYAEPSEFVKKFGIKNFILYTGRIEPRKNQLNFIRAMKGFDAPIVFIGKAVSDYQTYYDACRKEAGKNVHFLGYIDHGSSLLRSAYSAASVFALTTWFETPGLSALEAALAGGKIVITPSGSTREYFLEMVRYARPHKLDEIRQKVEEAYSAPPEPKLKEHIIKNYTWEKIAFLTKSAYKNIL